MPRTTPGAPILVERIDVEALTETLWEDSEERLRKLAAEGHDTEAETFEGISLYPSTLGVVATPKGSYVLSDEGVGGSTPLTEDSDEVAVRLHIHARWTNDEGREVGSLLPVASLSLTLAQLTDYLTGETVPLQHFIRSFGARLDSNYEQWRRAIEKARTARPADEED